jgi:hypothetical protein
MILKDIGVSSFGPISITRVPSVVSKNIALSPAMTMKNTLAHQAALGTYMCGAMMKNNEPVTRFIANPVIAHGMNAFAAVTGTRRMKPSRRRSKAGAADEQGKTDEVNRLARRPQPRHVAHRHRDARAFEPGGQRIHESSISDTPSAGLSRSRPLRRTGISLRAFARASVGRTRRVGRQTPHGGCVPSQRRQSR